MIRDARDAARSLRQFPKRGRIVPEENNANVRELFVFPSYRMLYEIFDDQHEIQIIAFIHSARLLENALGE